MTVPGVYSPSQGQQPDYVDDWGPITREQFDFVMTKRNDIGIVDAAAYDATIRAAAESDGVGSPAEVVAAMFPKHLASLTICHNEHLGYYMTAAQAIEDGDHGYQEWVSEEEKQRAIETNETWYAQWYPETPIGFCILAASTFPALLTALNALRALEGE